MRALKTFVAFLVFLVLLFFAVGFLVDARGPFSEALPGIVLLAILALAAGFWIVRGIRRGRRSGVPGRGVLERFGSRHPGFFDVVGTLSINGFGLQWIDFHEPRADGSALATQWATVAFLPVAPVRRERVRAGPEQQRGVPFLIWWTNRKIERFESLPVDHRRSLRVYAFYYLLFLPLIFAPVVGGLAWALAHDTGGRSFWLGALVVLCWGIACMGLERRLMGPVVLKSPASS